MQGLDSETVDVQRCDASPAPAAAATAAAAWPSLHTPSSAGSTTTQGVFAKQAACADASIQNLTSSASPANSRLSSHSAPPALTPAKSRGKPKQISPSPLGEASSVGLQSALPSSHTSAWPSPTANASPSPTISTSATSAWHNRSSGRTAASSAGQSSMSEKYGTAAAQAKGCQPARGAAWGQPARTLASAVTPNRSAWSNPAPQSYHNSRQNSVPRTPWGVQSAASPDSTPTSKLQPNSQEAQTPSSQVKSESGSTGTEYATPSSTLRPWGDFGADSSPSSPEGRVSSPKNQRLSSRLTAASEVTPDGAHTPVRSKTSGRHCNLPGNANQVLSQPTACGLDVDTATSAAQPDLIAAEHPKQLEHEQPQAAAPVLDDGNVRLAELHAHIVAGEPCQSNLPNMLPIRCKPAVMHCHVKICSPAVLQVLSHNAPRLPSRCTLDSAKGKMLPSRGLCIGAHMLYADISFVILLQWCPAYLWQLSSICCCI